MSSKEIEIELRFPLNNPDKVIEFLNKNAKLTKKSIVQKDTYFTPHIEIFWT